MLRGLDQKRYSILVSKLMGDPGHKYSVKAIQRQTVVGRGDRLECRDTHLSNRSNTASLSFLRQGLRLDRVH